MNAKAKSWTTEEIATLQECSTVDEADSRIPNRSRGAIETKAGRLGVNLMTTETTPELSPMDKLKALQQEIADSEMSEEDRAALEEEFKMTTKSLKGLNDKDKTLIEYMISEINDNAKIPSTKEMAETMEWNYATVMDHLKNLKAQGYVEFQRKGVWVPCKDLSGKKIGLCLAELEED